MKKHTYLYLIILAFLVIFHSCKKDQYYIFDDIPRAQFGPSISKSILNEYADSLKSETFYYEPASLLVDTIFFDIYTLGEVQKKDRNYTLKQVLVPGANNAVAGKHYKGFDDPSISPLYVIKSDSVHARVPIIVLRDTELKTKTFTLKFELVANENFDLGEPTKISRKLLITDRLSQPNAWTASYSQYYLGAYSVRKHEFMIETTEKKWDQEFLANMPLDQMNYFKSVLGMALIDYNKNHPNEPLRADNGELITFPN